MENEQNFISFNVEAADKSFSFILSSVQIPSPGYTITYQNKYYGVIAVNQNYDSGHITVIVNELKKKIIEPKLLKI